MRLVSPSCQQQHTLACSRKSWGGIQLPSCKTHCRQVPWEEGGGLMGPGRSAAEPCTPANPDAGSTCWGSILVSLRGVKRHTFPSPPSLLVSGIIPRVWEASRR